MKRNILLILFLLLTTLNYDVNTYNQNQLKSVEATKKISVLSKNNNQNRYSKDKSNKYLKDKNNKNFKVTKKDLKNEIKKRKKYHRSLLSTYNKSFDNKYLEKIAYNSKRLSDLRNLL